MELPALDIWTANSSRHFQTTRCAAAAGANDRLSSGDLTWCWDFDDTMFYKHVLSYLIKSCLYAAMQTSVLAFMTIPRGMWFSMLLWWNYLVFFIQFFFELELCWVFNFNIHLSKGFKPIATVQRTAGDVFPVLRALRRVLHEEPALRHKDLAADHGYQQLPHQALTSCLQRDKNQIYVRINKKTQKTEWNVNKLVLGLTAWRLD